MKPALVELIESARRKPLLAAWLVLAYGLSTFVVLYSVFAPDSWFVWNWLEIKR